jgi:hypothetical protein
MESQNNGQFAYAKATANKSAMGNGQWAMGNGQWAK